MYIEYEYTFGLPRQIVWNYLMKEDIIRKSLPGCKSFLVKDTGKYVTDVEISAGPLQDIFTIEILLEKEKSPAYFQLRMKGKGNIGEFASNAKLFLKEIQNSTLISCKADAQVTGAAALAGQRILVSAASKGMDHFFQTVEKEIKITLYQLKRGGR
ncbi:carbon monoxide dehydrogenase [Bacillus sp. BRMEA1]|uniref:CoxG family protein n=1 Tax=Neobacillus endophyticus TaxID=2738405 RepID=UPI0015634EF0|nr:SRPBCC domain-containing protein [Neobacillus endophyticus]NRD79481.1 carbon monoxide dehydrogenase [Neobacillus endophyticus]